MHSTPSNYPRLAPSVIRRPRLETWLGRFDRVPVRFLVAPPGYGKTTAIIAYLRSRGSVGLYCSVEHGATAADVREAVGRACGAPCASYGDLLELLRTRAPIELAFDCSGAPDADAVATIRRLIDDLPEGLSLLVASRSRAELEVGRLVSSGMGSLCDASRLAFDPAEVRHLAETCRVPFTETEVGRILDACEGWPLVLSSAVRKAAEDGCNLAAALENWRNGHGHLFGEF